MNTKSIALTALGIIAILVVLLILPTPLHTWFVNDSIGPVPADVAVMALIILFTPVTVLSLILSKFDVDFTDEVPADQGGSAIHAPM